VETPAPAIARLVLPQVDRALALMDRDPTSPTHGSMDRTFWYYRTLTNFAGAIWQQPMVGFAAIYATKCEFNPRAGDPSMLAAAQAALVAWGRAQNRGGAFDEWYLNEYSYCPTAITTLGAVTALHLLGDNIATPVRARTIETARFAAQWLSTRYNPTVMNQNIANVVALAGLARITNEREWETRARTILARIAEEQSAEGWLPEYGGFDFGYSTLALDFLALAADFGLADAAEPIAGRLVDFLLEVTEPACPLPGRIGSRGTAHVFLAGALMLAPRSDGARQLAGRLLKLLENGLAPRPCDIDDRYFAYFYFPAFALALRAAALRPAKSLEELEPASDRTFDQPQSGLIGRRTGNRTIVINRRLGGAAAILRPGTPARYHLGYTATASNGKRYSTAGWREDQAKVSGAGNLEAHAIFTKVSSGQPLIRLMVPFQLVAYLLLTSRLAEAFQSIVKRIMIAPRATLTLAMTRTVSVTDSEVLIRDQISPQGKVALRGIDVTTTITMHSPSARQDKAESFSLDAALRKRVVAQLNAGQTIALNWVLRPDAAAHVEIDEANR
jgi:hypothetical protein